MILAISTTAPSSRSHPLMCEFDMNCWRQPPRNARGVPTAFHSARFITCFSGNNVFPHCSMLSDILALVPAPAPRAASSWTPNMNLRYTCCRVAAPNSRCKCKPERFLCINIQSLWSKLLLSPRRPGRRGLVWPGTYASLTLVLSCLASPSRSRSG